MHFNLGLHKCVEPRVLDKKYHRGWKGINNGGNDAMVMMINDHDEGHHDYYLHYQLDLICHRYHQKAFGTKASTPAHLILSSSSIWHLSNNDSNFSISLVMMINYHYH